MALPQRDVRHHTYAEYLTWSEGGYNELIGGTAYVKQPPAPSRAHQELVGALHLQVGAALEAKPCRVYVAPFDVRLPRSEEADELIDTVVQPDLLIVCDLNKLDERGMRGAPDWIAEVLSPTTASYDQTVKLPIYEHAGVPEVWLVHPLDRILHIHRLEDRRYGRATIHELQGRTRIGVVPAVYVDWDRLRAS